LFAAEQRARGNFSWFSIRHASILPALSGRRFRIGLI
jgi:hypothetical protein